jgi:hypothetical protein
MFVLNGQPISPDIPFTHNGVAYPSNWIRLASPSERAAIGITEVVEAPKPDEFYAAVAPDPANPGQWLSFPYNADQMKVRLKDYSRGKRDQRAGAGVSHAIGADTFMIPTDVATRDVFFSYRIIQERPGAPTTTPYDFGTKVIALTEPQLLAIEQQMEDRIHGCLTTQLNLQAQIEGGTVTVKEQIDAAYAAVP